MGGVYNGLIFPDAIVISSEVNGHTKNEAKELHGALASYVDICISGGDDTKQLQAAIDILKTQ